MLWQGHPPNTHPCPSSPKTSCDKYWGEGLEIIMGPTTYHNTESWSFILRSQSWRLTTIHLLKVSGSMGRTLEGKLVFPSWFMYNQSLLVNSTLVHRAKYTREFCRAFCSGHCIYPYLGMMLRRSHPRDLGNGRKYRISYRNLWNVTDLIPTLPCSLDLDWNLTCELQW